MARLGEIGRILAWIVATWPRRSRRRNPMEETHAFFAERLTDSGKTVGYLWLASLPVAMLPGSPAGLVFALLSAVLGVSFIATLRAPRHRVELLGVWNAVAQGSATVRLRVTNPQDRTIEGAGAGLFRALEGLESRDAIACVDHLEPGQFVDVTISVKCLSRGPTGFAGIGAVRSDVFGLTRARRIDFEPLELLVAPEPLRVVPAAFLFGGGEGRAFAEAAGAVADPERIFQGVRPFREGDRLRDLDHKAWARWNAPVVREFGVAPGRGIAVSVETCCDGLLERSLLEPMLRLACGVAVEFCQMGCLGSLVVDGVECGIGGATAAGVARVFSAIPRCGWGKWPTAASVRSWRSENAPTLVIGVSREVALRRQESTDRCKRILLVAHEHDAVGSSEVLAVAVRAMSAGEVVL